MRWPSANAGSRLKPLIIQEGTAWTASLPAVLGKTRRTEIEETSASFEARTAPRSYPTTPDSRSEKMMQCSVERDLRNIEPRQIIR
jgi:hypothetical protein